MALSFGVSQDNISVVIVFYGYKIAKISDTPNSAIYHGFIDLLAEGRIKIANHPKTLDELLALNVDEKTGKVSRPAGGSKDCADALVSLVSLLRKLPAARHDPSHWIPPHPPELEQLQDGQYRIINPKTKPISSTLTLI